MRANKRFVYAPYPRFAYPMDVYYPAYTYPRLNSAGTGYPPASWNDVPPVQRQDTQKKDVDMRPFVFRNYIPPNYYQLWDYNMGDLQAAMYNEHLRKQLLHYNFSNRL